MTTIEKLKRLKAVIDMYKNYDYSLMSQNELSILINRRTYDFNQDTNFKYYDGMTGGIKWDKVNNDFNQKDNI